MPNLPAAHLPNSECSLFLCHCLREYKKMIPLQKVAFKLDISASSGGNPEYAG